MPLPRALAPLLLLVLFGFAAAVPAQQQASISPAETANALTSFSIGQLEAAHRALMSAQNPAVREYAREAANDYNRLALATLQATDTLARDPRQTAMSRRMRELMERNEAQLDQLLGTAFDTAFLVQQVQLQTLALEMVEERLPPTANPALGKVANQSRRVIARNLEQAHALLDQLTQREGETPPRG